MADPIDKPRQALYKFLGRFVPEAVLPFATDFPAERAYVDSEGTTRYVAMDSKRYSTFRQSLSCWSCGLTGDRMFLELPPDAPRPHFNLYGVDSRIGKKGSDLELVQFTKDHIVPKSQGGANHQENYRTMCFICNEIRGKDDLSAEDLMLLRVLWISMYERIPGAGGSAKRKHAAKAFNIAREWYVKHLVHATGSEGDK